VCCLERRPGGRSRSCDSCNGVSCVQSTSFYFLLPSVEALVRNGDTIRVTSIALPFPNGKNVTLPSLPSQLDGTPPVLGAVKDTLPVRDYDSDKFHPAVSKGASSDDSVVDIDFHNNPDALMCSYSAANDPESGVNATGYSM
jgi:hypothetical protein